MESINVNELTEKGMELALTYAPKALLAIVTLVIGLWLIGSFAKVFRKQLEKRSFDASLRNFFVSLVSVLLKVILFISVASMIGIQTTSFIAVLGAAGLAIGMALQGSLGNFAGGVLLILFRPIKVGDFIQAQGKSGTVKEIQIFCTILTTPDNKTIILPNGALAGGAIENFSTQPTRRVDMVFGIGYGDDIKKAKEVLEKIVKEDSRVLAEPAPVIAVNELGDSSVNFVVRPWVNASDYWGLYWDTHEKVKLTFDEQGISIPFPQRDVHLYNEK